MKLFFDEYLIAENVSNINDGLDIIKNRHSNNPPSYYRIVGDENSEEIMIDFGSWSHFYYLKNEDRIS